MKTEPRLKRWLSFKAFECYGLNFNKAKTNYKREIQLVEGPEPGSQILNAVRIRGDMVFYLKMLSSVLLGDFWIGGRNDIVVDNLIFL